MAKIIAVGLANPERRLTQEESWFHLQRLRKLSPLENKYYKRFMLDEGIHSRHLALKELEDIFNDDPDFIIGRYSDAAVKIAGRSSLSAIKKAGIEPETIDFLSTASCTGYLCPGLSSYISEAAKLRTGVAVLDLQGMGCGAALPALSSAVNHLANSKGESFALVNCTEICSAAVFWDDDLGLILSNSIFGDGSAAVILSNHSSLEGPEIIGYQSVIFPEEREALRFKIDKGKLRNSLTAAVPEVAAKGVGLVINKLLQNNQLKQTEIKFWALHTGGRKVLSVIAEKNNLSGGDLTFSEEILRDYGNMSSPSVLFVLEKIISSGRPQAGDFGIMLSFGAGFACYGMLLKW